MKVLIKRVDKTLSLPRCETAGSVGFDFLARKSVKVTPKSLALVPGNVIVEVPKGYMLLIASRSSTPKKKGLLTPHGIGVLDQDYCGPEDEAMIQVYNFTDQVVIIERGERIAQGIFVRVDRPDWVEVEEVTSATRGGIGSTG
jgi:dUTP pyrophosphatase